MSHYTLTNKAIKETIQGDHAGNGLNDGSVYLLSTDFVDFRRHSIFDVRLSLSIISPIEGDQF